MSVSKCAALNLFSFKEIDELNFYDAQCKNQTMEWRNRFKPPIC